MSFTTDFEGLPEPRGIAWDGNRTHGMVQYGDARNLFVSFYRRSVEDPQASQAAGRRICKGVDHVRIQPPGERLTVIDRPATMEDRVRWPSQWQQYAQNQQQVPDGTPIDLLFPNYPEIGDTLRGLGVHTVEMCAALSGNAIDTIGMGAQEYVNAAKRYLEHAQRGVQHHELEKVIKDHQQQLRLRDHQIENLNSQVTHLLNLLQQSKAASLPMPPTPPGTIPSAPPAQPTSYLPMPGMPLSAAQPLAPPPTAILPQPTMAPSAPAIDPQTAMINASHASGEQAVQAEKKNNRGWPKGKPRGPRKPKVDAPDTTNGQDPSAGN